MSDNIKNYKFKGLITNKKNIKFKLSNMKNSGDIYAKSLFEKEGLIGPVLQTSLYLV